MRYLWNSDWEILPILKESDSSTSFSSSRFGSALESSSIRNFLSSFAPSKSMSFSSSIDFKSLERFSNMTILISFLLASFSMKPQ